MAKSKRQEQLERAAARVAEQTAPKPGKRPPPDWPATLPAPAPKRKTPTAAEIVEMGARFAQHAEAVRAMLSDVQKIVEEGWPPADPERDGNLHELLMNFLRPAEIRAVADEAIVCDTTLDATISDLTTLLDDMVPGTEQGEWAREILASADATATKKPTTRPKSK
jgi:hypothetical protein